MTQVGTTAPKARGSLAEAIAEAAAANRSRTALVPEVGIICGTGMGGLAGKVENATVLPYDDIPHFPVSTGQRQKSVP